MAGKTRPGARTHRAVPYRAPAAAAAAAPAAGAGAGLVVLLGALVVAGAALAAFSLYDLWYAHQQVDDEDDKRLISSKTL